MMAAARILVARRGKSLISGKYCASLPKLDASIVTSSRQSSTNPNLKPGSQNAGGDESPPPPPKRHPQSFVQPNIPLELGELETELPPRYHQEFDRKQRGPLKPRHDGDGRDSYWRPPWKSPRAEIVSAEDFANRPRVTFSESFASLHDAMGVLSWMTQEDKHGMYKLYLDMMTEIAAQNESKSKRKGGRDVADEDWGVLTAHTSHEYVVRVVAQKYNVTTSRAAGVIQLQHNEEQLKKDPDFELQHHLQAHMDKEIRKSIRDLYQSYGEVDPLQFVEDPVASTGNVARDDSASPMFLGASELTDVDALIKRTKMRELEDHRIRISNHIYVEDVDRRSQKVKIDQEARQLLKMQGELGRLYEGFAGVDGKEGKGNGADDTKDKGPGGNGSEVPDKDGDDEVPEAYRAKKPRTKVPKLPHEAAALPAPPSAASPFPENNVGHKQVQGNRRPRWKFAAQIVNTHMMENPPGSKRRGKAVARLAKGRRHGRVIDGNTIIEEGGVLRVASVADLEQTSWKHVRNESEIMFKGVKEAWLRRQLEGEVGGWGIQEEMFKAEETEATSSEEGQEGEGAEQDADTSDKGENKE